MVSDGFVALSEGAVVGTDQCSRFGEVACLNMIWTCRGFAPVCFARDTRFHLDRREAFRKRGATIECLNFKFDDTPEGEFIETIMAAQGALERKLNGRQLAQKMKACMQNGCWVHTRLWAIAIRL